MHVRCYRMMIGCSSVRVPARARCSAPPRSGAPGLRLSPTGPVAIISQATEATDGRATGLALLVLVLVEVELDGKEARTKGRIRTVGGGERYRSVVD